MEPSDSRSAAPPPDTTFAAAQDATSQTPNELVLLSDLPRGHELRTRPLRELQAECCNKLSKQWRSVERWGIGAVSYDELGTSWTDTSVFHARAHRDAP
ncbi:MAG TPA: hypothetical protein VJ608_11505 [Albitalea sp.]|nr:hypothetical protein [Albitalea sp.]